VVDDAPSIAAAKPRFRRDVEGLRAIAVSLVVAFHAGVGIGGGFVGVDVFYVISGFLITGLLVREASATGTVSLRRFWARRVRRLLPVSAIVLTATTLAVSISYSTIDRPTVDGDVASAALYASNWHFAARAIDYLAQDAPPSPVSTTGR
jgi:peptidoglycan/LPS O-acetylase OafA/YrhL